MTARSKAWVCGQSFAGIASSNPVDSMDVLLGLKGSGTEADYSPPANAKVKNEWNCTSSSLICLHIVDGQKFIFIFYRICVLCDDESAPSLMIVPNIDCCVGPYCYRVEETSRHAAATATLHFLPQNRPPCFQKPLQELIS